MCAQLFSEKWVPSKSQKLKRLFGEWSNDHFLQVSSSVCQSAWLKSAYYLHYLGKKVCCKLKLKIISTVC